MPIRLVVVSCPATISWNRLPSSSCSVKSVVVVAGRYQYTDEIVLVVLPMGRDEVLQGRDDRVGRGDRFGRR